MTHSQTSGQTNTDKDSKMATMKKASVKITGTAKSTGGNAKNQPMKEAKPSSTPVKVSQATLNKIKADGMQKALLKVGTYKGTPEYREGVKRLYGQARITAAEKSAPAQKILSAPKNVPGTKSPGGFMSQNEIKKFVAGAAKANLALPKAVLDMLKKPAR